jgi:putative transposase
VRSSRSSMRRRPSIQSLRCAHGWMYPPRGYYEWRDRPASSSAQRRGRPARSSRRSLISPTAPTAIAGSTPPWPARASTAAPSWSTRSCVSWAWSGVSLGRGVRPQPSPGEGGESIPDLVARDFTAAAPGTKLVGDITYLPTWQGFAYLATVIDCCTKECIGYAIADHMRAQLVIDALRMAARNYRLEPGAIFHTDRGSQYLSQAFAETAAQLDSRHSVGRVGSCFDNALAESFNAALKVERVNRTVSQPENTPAKTWPDTSSSATIPNGSTQRCPTEHHGKPTPTI